MATDKRRGVPLIRAAQRLKMSPERVRRRIAEGRLKAWQGENGRWVVDSRSIDAAVREMSAENELAAVPA